MNVPFPANKTVIAIEAGAIHSCALYDSGEIDCWGEFTRLGYIPSTSDNGRINSTGQSTMHDSCQSCSNFTLGDVDSDGDGAIEYLEDYPGNPNKSIRCQEGTYGSHSCTDASIGYYVDVKGSIEQYECAPGTFQPISGQSSCLAADPGYYVQVTAATSQTACSLGTYQPSAAQSSCLDADPGYYVDDTGSSSQTACATGTYQPSAGQSSCLDADPGHKVWSTGQTSQTPCYPGNYHHPQASHLPRRRPGHRSGLRAKRPTLPIGNYAIRARPPARRRPGYYVQVTAATSQTDCSLGTYQPSAAQSSCLDADPGYYVDDTGSSSQTACATGTYQPSAGQSAASTPTRGTTSTPLGLQTKSHVLLGHIIRTTVPPAKPLHFCKSWLFCLLERLITSNSRRC